MNVCTKFYGSLSNSCRDISLWSPVSQSYAVFVPSKALSLYLKLDMVVFSRATVNSWYLVRGALQNECV